MFTTTAHDATHRMQRLENDYGVTVVVLVEEDEVLTTTTYEATHPLPATRYGLRQSARGRLASAAAVSATTRICYTGGALGQALTSDET